MNESKQMIKVYDQAVQRIGYRGKSTLNEEASKYEKMINHLNRDKKRTLPLIESTDLDGPQAKPRVKAGLQQFNKNLNLGLVRPDQTGQSSRSARTASTSGRSQLVGDKSLLQPEIPEVFNRLYKQE